MAFTRLIGQALDCRFVAYYHADEALFIECLDGIPAFTNCLLCGVSKTTGARELTYFIPQGELFERSVLEPLFDKSYRFEMVFFDTGLDGIPIFSVPGVKVFRISSISQLSTFVSLLDYEEKNSFLFKDNVLSATLEKICLYILRDMNAQSRNIFDQITNHFSNERLLKILGHIHEHITRELTLENLAKLVFLSPDYISQFFKRCVGMSIQTYLIEQRVKLGLNALVTSTEPISGIAETTGFIDQAYFNRRFKAVYGLNPLKLRKKYQLLAISQGGMLMSL
jgi:AraC-like DNA-binding protein